MKKFKIFLIVLPILTIGLILLAGFLQTNYKDGTYTGRSRSHYTREPFVGEVKIDIKGGRITKIDFSITIQLKKSRLTKNMRNTC
jgi:major membrane immunogen (membrane-anchored lipoprotein)